ncbi:PilN domain-containing protein [Marimonas arenosa]|uniref:PilN domain-containing protein n=1 Tax=Marimonas arenosa TaxID=1795305 RepID=A0AAE3WDQ9_9RHOB|nr:PilN domain-containing protein [Marimonas arenosa]MDQ2090852.1 PilN domain-containing protein [Marimonas arenosa]
MLAELQDITRRFLSWWGKELRGCLPRGLAATFFGSEDVLEVEIRPDELSLGLRDDGTFEELGTVPIGAGDVDSAAAATRKLLGRRASARSVTIRLPHKLALGTIVELPVEAADNLEEALTFELDSFTPFPTGEALFDFTVLNSDEELERLRIGLLVARRRDVDKALDWARRIGVRPDRIAGPTSEEPALDAFNLLPRAERRQRSRFVPRAAAALAITALSFAAATQFVWFDRKSGEIARLQALEEDLRAKAGAAGKLRDRVIYLTDLSRQLTEKKTGEPMAIALLDELSRVLPESDWLSSWSINGKTLKASGYSADPAVTLRLIESSDLLSGAQFTSPLTIDPQLGKERFNLEATVITERQQQ